MKLRDSSSVRQGRGVHHLDEPRVENHLRRQRGNRDQAGAADGEDRGNGLEYLV